MEEELVRYLLLKKICAGFFELVGRVVRKYLILEASPSQHVRMLFANFTIMLSYSIYPERFAVWASNCILDDAIE